MDKLLLPLTIDAWVMSALDSAKSGSNYLLPWDEVSSELMAHKPMFDLAKSLADWLTWLMFGWQGTIHHRQASCVSDASRYSTLAPAH